MYCIYLCITIYVLELRTHFLIYKIKMNKSFSNKGVPMNYYVDSTIVKYLAVNRGADEQTIIFCGDLSVDERSGTIRGFAVKIEEKPWSL